MRSAARRKTWLVVVLSVPAILFAFDAARGQPDDLEPRHPPPHPRRPPRPVVKQPAIPPPQREGWVTVWSCLRCGRELRRGDAKPTQVICPGCGDPLTDFATSQVPATTNASANSNGISTSTIVLVAVAIFELLLVGVLAYLLRPRRVPDEDFARPRGWMPQSPRGPRDLN